MDKGLPTEPDVAAVGALVAHPARCRMLSALTDGGHLSASRLAAEAGVSAATASSHLAKLTAAGLVLVERAGRHRYYRLAGAEVAGLIENLEWFAPPTSPRSPRQVQRARALREARVCFDHLGGRIGVLVMQSLLDRRLLVEDRLTPDGVEFLVDLGVGPVSTATPVRNHMDSSERRPHIHGSLGTALLERFLSLGWAQRSPDSPALLLTTDGSTGLARKFDIEAPPAGGKPAGSAEPPPGWG